MAELVGAQLVAILDSNADSLGGETGFVELGLDSFAALERRVRLELLLDCPLPETLAFDYPSIATVLPDG